MESRSTWAAPGGAEPIRRIPRRCYYCGRRIQGAYVCPLHRTVFEADPLGRTARLPLYEGDKVYAP